MGLFDQTIWFFSMSMFGYPLLKVGDPQKGCELATPSLRTTAIGCWNCSSEHFHMLENPLLVKTGILKLFISDPKSWFGCTLQPLSCYFLAWLVILNGIIFFWQSLATLFQKLTTIKRVATPENHWVEVWRSTVYRTYLYLIGLIIVYHVVIWTKLLACDNIYGWAHVSLFDLAFASFYCYIQG